jgi:hypothetical protein
MKTPIIEILLRCRPLSREHQAAFLRSMIVKEQTDGNGKFNLHRTSVRIRELQAALQEIQTRRLKRERAA